MIVPQRYSMLHRLVQLEYEVTKSNEQQPLRAARIAPLQTALFAF